MPNSWVPGSRDLEPHLAVDWMKSLTLGYKLNPGTKTPARVFPGGPVLETPYFQCRRCKFDPSSGTKIPYAVQGIAKKKKKNLFNNNNKKRNTSQYPSLTCSVKRKH